MQEQVEAIDKMIDWIEHNLSEAPTLLQMSRQIGYSPWYCSSLFHRIVGKTIKSYVAGRRLSRATLEIRDNQERILDIAVKYGFSSQQALTRAFVQAYGLTPAAYRREPRPIPLSIRKQLLFPEDQIRQEGIIMSEFLTRAGVRVEYIPAHKYIGIWDKNVDNYMAFWEGRNCDEICGVIDSMDNVQHPVVSCHTAGWTGPGGNGGYVYGLGVPMDYSGAVPDGFEIRAFPGSYYLVFYHPAFDFLKDCAEVMQRVEDLAWGYDPTDKGFQWNEEACLIYQRHMPETIGYEVLRPVKRA